MTAPLPDSLVSILKSDATAALAALMVIAGSHGALLQWVARLSGDDPPQRWAKQPRQNSNGGESCGRKTNGSAYARLRNKRNQDDLALVETMRRDPDANIMDLAVTIGKSRSSTVSALQRLRDAGLAESIDRKWRLTEKRQPVELPPCGTAPLSASHRAAAHATV